MNVEVLTVVEVLRTKNKQFHRTSKKDHTTKLFCYGIFNYPTLDLCRHIHRVRQNVFIIIIMILS